MAELDSNLELVIVEGEGIGASFPLQNTVISLGRREPADQPSTDRIGFAESTVSRQHAQLEWNSAKVAYSLVHLSRTNATLVNGQKVANSRLLQAGDNIRMGKLVLNLRRVGVPAAPNLDDYESPYRVLILTGPEQGNLLRPLARRTTLLSPDAPPVSGGLCIEGLRGTELELVDTDGKLQLKARKLHSSTKLYYAWPGLFQEIPVGPNDVVDIHPQAAIACGSIAFSVLPEKEALVRRAQIQAGEPGHLAAPHIAQPASGHTFVLAVPHEHTLRSSGGTLAKHKLWLEPSAVVEAVRLGQRPGSMLTLAGGEAELTFENNRPLLKNVDSERDIEINWEKLKPGEQRALASGDRFQLGDTTLIYEHFPTQHFVSRLALVFDDEEMPFAREVDYLGHDPEGDFFLNSDEVEARHGQVRVSREGEVTYRHLADRPAQLGDRPLTKDEESLWIPDQILQLSDSVQLRLVRH